MAQKPVKDTRRTDEPDILPFFGSDLLPLPSTVCWPSNARKWVCRLELDRLRRNVLSAVYRSSSLLLAVQMQCLSFQLYLQAVHA